MHIVFGSLTCKVFTSLMFPVDNNKEEKCLLTNLNVVSFSIS